MIYESIKIIPTFIFALPLCFDKFMDSMEVPFTKM